MKHLLRKKKTIRYSGKHHAIYPPFFPLFSLPQVMPLETSLLEEEDEEEEEGDEDSNDENNSQQPSPEGDKQMSSPPPPPPTTSSQQQQQQQQPMFHCPFCAKPFHARWMLERHLPSHTGQRPYKCVRCERRFSLQSSAVRHVKNVHRGENFDAEAEASSMVIKDKDGDVGGLGAGGAIGGGGGGGGGVGDGVVGADAGARGVVDAGENQIVIG